jgi:hypothetical protein
MNLNARTAILERIRRKGRGWVFTPLEFPAVPDTEVVKNVLQRLRRRGRLREITAGVFHFPRRVRELGIEVPPEPLKVAKAVARLHGHRIAPSGAAAANYLGLSLQVPAKPVYLTDGPDNEIPLGKSTIVLRHAPADQVRVGGDLERTLVQAILYLGRDGVDEAAILKMRRAVPPQRRGKVLAASQRVGGWVGNVLREIAAPRTSAVVPHG